MIHKDINIRVKYLDFYAEQDVKNINSSKKKKEIQLHPYENDKLHQDQELIMQPQQVQI